MLPAKMLKLSAGCEGVFWEGGEGSAGFVVHVAAMKFENRLMSALVR